jgi:membrane-anchored protein YejM (alkaline phosphatase superfamily)
MNLLLISVDSLRLDYVSRFADQVKTPRFDRASSGFGFHPGCFSVSTATRPVHASLFTGLYPFEHGVQGMQVPQTRSGLADLFGLFASQGYSIEAYSQATSVFSGLECAHPVVPWFPGLESTLLRPRPQPRCVFLHYWSTHAPYGAADGKATGSTLELLRRGRRDLVEGQYRHSVESLFEEKLAPLLEGLSPEAWTVFIFGDHGETWDKEEYYHGQTLRNVVLRVPLFYHIPHTGNLPITRPVISLLDLFPTLVSLFGLGVDYRGFGRGLLAPDAVPAAPYYLAELHPTPHLDDLDPSPIGGLAAPQKGKGAQWALFDEKKKFTCYSAEGRSSLETTWDEEDLRLDNGLGKAYLQAYEKLVASSAYADAAKPQLGDQELLNQRLRDLGYLA